MQVLHTDDEPPNQGRIIFATMGWIWNSRKAERKTVTANSGVGRGVCFYVYRMWPPS